MTTDPRTAPLAAALRKYDRRRLGDPEGCLAIREWDLPAILAALPPDWCGHDPDIYNGRYTETVMVTARDAANNREIATLRAALDGLVLAAGNDVPNEADCTCDRDDDSDPGGPVVLCEKHERMLRPLRWDTLAMMAVDLLAYEAGIEVALDALRAALGEDR